MGMGIYTLECPLGSMFSFKLKHTAAPPLFREYFEFEIGPSNKDHYVLHYPYLPNFSLIFETLNSKIQVFELGRQKYISTVTIQTKHLC